MGVNNANEAVLVTAEAFTRPGLGSGRLRVDAGSRSHRLERWLPDVCVIEYEEYDALPPVLEHVAHAQQQVEHGGPHAVQHLLEGGGLEHAWGGGREPGGCMERGGQGGRVR